MPINVTCPNCLARWNVSDKFAGKKGPCPKCKVEIRVPELKEQVVIHAPQDEGPKDSTGRAVLKPIQRMEKPINKLALIGGLSLASVVLIVSIVLRFTTASPPAVILVVGAVALAIPIVLLLYRVLWDDELQGYEGNELWIRAGICSAVYAFTWGVYVLLTKYFGNDSTAENSFTEMGIYMAIMIAIGTLTAMAALELEAGQAALHYLGYFGTTLVLCFIMGVPLAEPLKRETAVKAPPPTSTETAPNLTPAQPPGGGGVNL